MSDSDPASDASATDSSAAESRALHQQNLSTLLERVASGDVSVQTAATQIVSSQTKTVHTAAAAVDIDRATRCGFPEVVYCPGKTPSAVCEIFESLKNAEQDCLGTRASSEQAAALQAIFPKLIYNPTARTVRLDVTQRRQAHKRVAVITAGTSDLPVAEEAVETLRWMHIEPELIVDVGVAGPHRLVEQRHRFVNAETVIVVAGMEGALPSVVGGHVACPVIAVPTSVGYGASFGGLSALLGMLNSCAANVAVVNIDAGFKAAFIAGLPSPNA